MIREISIKSILLKEIQLQKRPFIHKNRVDQCWLYKGIAVYVHVLVRYALFCDFQSSVPILDISCKRGPLGVTCTLQNLRLHSTALFLLTCVMFFPQSVLLMLLTPWVFKEPVWWFLRILNAIRGELISGANLLKACLDVDSTWLWSLLDKN